MIHGYMTPRYTDCRLYLEPLWFPSLYFIFCSPQSSWPHFAVSFSSEMAILIYSLCFPRLWDMVFSLGRMCFECTLLFKIFIRFNHFTFCVGVLATCMSVCHVGAWCHRRSEEGNRVLWPCDYGWLWTSMVGKGGITAQGWNIRSPLHHWEAAFHLPWEQEAEGGGSCHSASFLLFLFVFPTRPVCGQRDWNSMSSLAKWLG